MSTNSWYPFYVGDYLRDTQHLTFAEDAAYRRLLDAGYMGSRLPSPSVGDPAIAAANADVLLRVCRAFADHERAAVLRVAGEFFETRDGYLYHARVEQHLAKTRSMSAIRAEAGRRGASVSNARRPAIAAANAEANAAASAVAIATAIPEPKVNPLYPLSVKKSRKARAKKDAVLLSEFLAQCKADGVSPIHKDDPIFTYAAKCGIDHEMLEVAWAEFKEYWLSGEGAGERRADWRATYRRFIRHGGYGLWIVRGDEPARWTSIGEQARRAAA